MNERIIWDFVSKARGFAVSDTPDGGKCFDQDVFHNKFAELIVRECMDIADEQKKWVENMEVFNEQDATWNKARIQQSQQIVDKIKQHFGVEE